MTNDIRLSRPVFCLVYYDTTMFALQSITRTVESNQMVLISVHSKYDKSQLLFDSCNIKFRTRSSMQAVREYLNKQTSREATS